MQYCAEARKGLEDAVKFVFSKLEYHEKSVFPSTAHLKGYVINLSSVDALLRGYTDDSYPDLLGEVYTAIREKLGILPEELSFAKRGRKKPQSAARDVWVTEPILGSEEKARYVKKSRLSGNGVRSGANYFAQVISSMANRYELDENLLIKNVLDSEAASHVVLKENKVIEVRQRVSFYKLVMHTAKKLCSDSE